MIHEMDFSGRHILIDGAGRGIGKEVALQLNHCGAKLSLLDMNSTDLEEVKEELHGDGNSIVACDLSHLDQIGNMLKDIVASNGPLDGFVHCVGMRCRRPINILTPEVLQQVMNTNFLSFMELTRNIVKKGNFRKGLSIVAISSISAHTGGVGVSGYAASKAAMEGAIRCLAHELASKGVRLNSVQPGQTHTPAYDEAFGDGSHDPVLERQYLGLAEPQDVSNAVLFLLSEASRMISGISLPVDCGYYTS